VFNNNFYKITEVDKENNKGVDLLTEIGKFKDQIL
jgi:hypothetical protein